MWDPTKINLLAACDAPGIHYALCSDPQQNYLYGAGSDRSVYRVDLTAEKLIAEKRWTSHANYVSALVAIDGTTVCSASYDGHIHWTAAESGERLRSVRAHDGWIRDLVATSAGQHLASVGDDMLVKLWDYATGELVRTFAGHPRQTREGYATALYAVDVSPDGKYLASGDRRGEVCVWDVASGKLAKQLHAPALYTYDARARVRSIGGIRAVRFSPDGTRLALAGIGRVTNVDGFVGPCRLELWDWQANQCISACEDPHKAVFNDIVFHPTEPWLIGVGGGDSGGILGCWDLAQAQLTHKAKPKGHLQRLILAADGERIFAAGYQGMQVWVCREK